jgi:DNA-binding response OmpR family regulator
MGDPPSSASGAHDRPHDNQPGRVGGTRADFVASLGRKVHDARELLSMLEDDPSSKAARDELRRRLHALGTGARLLHFDAMTHSLKEALAVIDRGAQAGTLREQDLGFIAEVLDDLPALAWGEIPPPNPPTRSHQPLPSVEEPAEQPQGPGPISVLVVGDERLADALTDDASPTRSSFECERTEDPDTALELARAYAPDILVVDVDMPRAPELVEGLLDDPLTDPVPVIVVGTWPTPEASARFVALGVDRTLSKPILAHQLRAACDEIIDTREGRTLRVTLGEPTLEQLADRLCEELRRGLIDSVDRPARSHQLPLGEGTEVLGAMWGAIARVQEIVSQKTAGLITFGAKAPEGATALAPWLHNDLPGAERFVGRSRGAAADVRLQGRRVVMADDDPGVTWFVSDLLRAAGCEVHEALDGATALDLAFRFQPELVVSDILMPGLDGFALCRALRRDVALRDTPVILLSWKEDLLQRVRELGASAAAYMRKESGSRTILARVREVLRPRARIEARLHADGEVRGRLDGLTPRLLLELTCHIRKDARVSIRDATYLYEVEVRAGSPRRTTRTASDGSHMSGERALASLLGIGAGRFVVGPSQEPIHGEWTGTLFDQLSRPIAAARGALAATTGTRTMDVERVLFDGQALDDYLRATPEPTRSLIRTLAQGVAPRKMLLRGGVSPSLLEDVLSDLAARGTIRAVEGPGGVDLLTSAIEGAFAVLRGMAPPRPSAIPDARASEAPPASPTRARGPVDARMAKDTDGVPSSLEDAVMRELSDRSPPCDASRDTSSGASRTQPLPSIIELSELRPRSSEAPEGDFEIVGADHETPSSIPPDAIVPETNPQEEFLASPSRSREPEPIASSPVPPPALADDTIPVSRVRTTAPEPPRARSSRGRWVAVLAVGLLGIAMVTVLRHANEEQQPGYVVGSAGPVATPTAWATQISSAIASVPSAGAGADDLPPGAEVPPGFGLLEVRAPAGAIVRVDGALAGSGPFVSTVTAPGSHEVRVGHRGHEANHVVDVHIGKATRIKSLLPP